MTEVNAKIRKNYRSIKRLAKSIAKWSVAVNQGWELLDDPTSTSVESSFQDKRNKWISLTFYGHPGIRVEVYVTFKPLLMWTP